MLKKVLAYSHDPFILKIMSDWAENDHLVDFHVTDSVEKLTDLFTSEVFSVLVLDDSDLQVSLSRLVQNLSQRQPGIKILLIQPQEGGSYNTSDNRYAVEHISKPISSETLNKALHDQVSTVWLPETTEIEPKVITSKTCNDEEDISYLRSWIKEAISDDSKPESCKVVAQPKASIFNKKPHDFLNNWAHSENTPVSVSKPGWLKGIKSPSSTSPTEHDLKPTQLVPTPTVKQVVTPKLTSFEPKSPILNAGLEKSTGFDIKKLMFHYTCILLPRDPNFYIIQVIAERITMILSKIHASHCWSLTGLAIRPHYVQWSIALPVQTSPVAAILEIRRLTSELLNTTLQDNHNKLKGQDFWAPGYLMVSGTEGIPYSMIKSFINLTRKEQSKGT